MVRAAAGSATGVTGAAMAGVGAEACRGAAVSDAGACAIGAPVAGAPAGRFAASHVASDDAVLSAMLCVTAAVTATHGSFAVPAGAISWPVMRLTRLPVGSVRSQMYVTLVCVRSFEATM